MPGAKFTRRAKASEKCARQWEHVYQGQKARGLDKGAAIRSASGVLKRNTKCKPAR